MRIWWGWGLRRISLWHPDTRAFIISIGTRRFTLHNLIIGSYWPQYRHSRWTMPIEACVQRPTITVEPRSNDHGPRPAITTHLCPLPCFFFSPQVTRRKLHGLWGRQLLCQLCTIARMCTEWKSGLVACASWYMGDDRKGESESLLLLFRGTGSYGFSQTPARQNWDYMSWQEKIDWC